MPALENFTKKKYLALFAACLGFVVVILDVSVVNVALEQLQAEFGSGISSLEWVVNGYTLTFAAFLLTTGALGDRYGAEPVFVGGFVVFGAASLACALSTDIVFLVVARIIQGIGAALLVPASLAIIHQAFTDSAERSRAIGLWAAAGGMALALGPVIGGILIHLCGWRSIFFVNIPIAALGIWLAAHNAPPAKGRRRRAVDWAGQLTAVITLGSLTAMIIEAGNLGLEAHLIWFLAIVCVAGIVGFIYAENRAPDPMLPLHLFSNPSFSASAAIGVIVNFAFYGLIFLFSLIFQQSWSYSPLTTGFAFLPMTGAIMCANIVAGRVMAKKGVRPVLLFGCLIAAAGYLAILPFATAQSYSLIAAQFLIAGFGIGLIVPSVTNATLSAVDAQHAGIGAGVINASRQVGGLLGVAIMGLIIQSAGGLEEDASLGVSISLSGLALIFGAVLTFTSIARPQATRMRKAT